MINFGHSSLAYLDPLLKEIILFLRDPSWCVFVVHVFREANWPNDLLLSLRLMSLLLLCRKFY